jgi:hypothetical protein
MHFQHFHKTTIGGIRSEKWSEGFYTIHIHTSEGKHYHLKWVKQ